MSIFVAVFINGIILFVIDQTEALVELPKVEDNHILKASIIIRDTTNNLFSALKFRGKKDNPDLKRLVLIHSYLVSLASKDYTSLTEVAKLTRVDKRNDFNVRENFIEILNKIIDNGNSMEIISKDNDNDSIVTSITNYMQNLEYITYFYSTHSPSLNVNTDIMLYFENKVADLQKLNSTSQADDEGLFKGLETWKPDTRRIYQGKRTKIKHYPFMASVEIFGKFTCGGSIIYDDLVITAASCLQLAWNNRFYRENPAFLSVRIGSTFFESGGERVEVLEVYFHPSYDPGTLRNNLAVMRLRRKIKFSRKNRKKVMKIEIDRNDHGLPSNADDITIIGWGAKTSSNVIHNAWEQRLSYDILHIYGLEDCQDVYSTQYVTSKHFCAGYISKGGGACNRDVGGPGVIDGILTGVISFGSPVCGANDSPTVFTKIGFYSDWIDDIMEQPVITGRQRTTTLATYYNIEWTPKATPKQKVRLIFKHKTTKSPEEEETTTTSTTTVKEDLEDEIKELLKKILRNEKKDDFSSDTDLDPNSMLKTKKKTTVSPLQKQILKLVRSSRMTEAATEIIPNSTMLIDVEPTVSFGSEADNDESIEQSKKATVVALNKSYHSDTTRLLKKGKDSEKLHLNYKKLNETQSKFSYKHDDKSGERTIKALVTALNKPDLSGPMHHLKQGEHSSKPNQNDFDLSETQSKLTKDYDKSIEQPNKAAAVTLKMSDLSDPKHYLKQGKSSTEPNLNYYESIETHLKRTKNKIEPEFIEDTSMESFNRLSHMDSEKPNYENNKPHQDGTKLKLQTDPKLPKITKDAIKTKKQQKVLVTVKRIYDETTVKPVKPITKKQPLREDDVVMNLLYASEKEKISTKFANNSDSVKENFNILTLGNAANDSDTSLSYSDTDSDAVGLNILQEPDTKLESRNKNINSTIQSILSEKDLYEILTEALRENLNFTLPEPTTSSPKKRKKYTTT